MIQLVARSMILMAMFLALFLVPVDWPSWAYVGSLVLIVIMIVLQVMHVYSAAYWVLQRRRALSRLTPLGAATLGPDNRYRELNVPDELQAEARYGR